MENEAFFKRDGGGYVANPVSRGPWNPQSLHGRVIIGLLAFELEQRHADPDFIPARLTVDMHHPRGGNRIKVIDAEFFSGGVGTAGPRRTWMSEVRELVAGTPLTPFMRVALCADFASPFANAGDKGLGYINSDVTLYINRLPVQEWVGLEVADHQAADGVAIGECFLYDVEGPIGSATCAALAQQRRMQLPPADADKA